MKRETILNSIVTIIIMMFLYASFSKYFDFRAFQRAMYNQPFPAWFSTVLIVIVPPAEILTSILLFREKTVKRGLQAAILLMTIFSLYIVAILLHFFGSEPCSCGGVISLLSWRQHLFFNLFFLAIAVIGIMIYKKTKGNTPATNPK